MTEPTLFEYQNTAKSGIYDLFRKGNRKVLTVIPGGGGKCLGKDTPVLMYSGIIKNVQDIIVGDKLMGNDNLPRNVLSTTIGYDKLYKINPIKGDSYVVNEDHILSLKIGSGEDNIIVNGIKYKQKDIVNITVRDYLKSSKWFKLCAKGWKSSANFEKSEKLEIDPYFLGLWLGDGHSRTISLTTGDIEIKYYLESFARFNNLKIRVEQNSQNSEVIHFSNIERDLNNGIRQKFDKLNLFQNKHIPLNYKKSTKNERLELLAGLIDSDGYLHHNGYDYISKIETLADDICFIARSVGLSAYKSKCTKGCTYKDEYKIGIYYRVYISGETNIIPCKIPRKKSNIRKQKKDVLTTGIKSVEYIGYGNYYGFEIDGNRLFLLGDFTVTHNTIIAGSMTKDFHVKQYQNETGKKVAFFTHREELLNQTREKFLSFGNITEPINSDTTYINPNIGSLAVMVETFNRRSDSDQFLKHFKDVGLLFIDEAHRADFNKILHHFEQAKITGLTATPISSDKKVPLNTIWNVMIEAATTTQLQAVNRINPEAGVVPCDCYTLEGIDRKNLKKKGNEFDEKSTSEKFREKKQKFNTLLKYDELGKGMKGLCFNVNIEHNEEMHQEFLAIGVPSRQLHSDSSKFYGAPSSSLAKNWRRDCLLWLKNTPGAILHNVGILTTGFDEPSIELIMTNYASLSISKVVQCHVRGARPYQYPNGEYKQYYRWLDFGGNCSYFNINGNNDVDWQGYFDQPYSQNQKNGIGGYKTCPNCKSMNPVAARFCSGMKEDWLSKELKECGHCFPVSIKEEDLVPREMIKFFTDNIIVNDLVSYARINGYQLTSVYFKIMDLISNFTKKSFGTFILKEQLDFIIDLSFKKVKELGKITGKKCWREGVRKSVIEKLKKDGMILDIEELGDKEVLDEIKHNESI